MLSSRTIRFLLGGIPPSSPPSSRSCPAPFALASTRWRWLSFFLSSFIIYFLWGWSRSIFSRLVYRPPRPRFFFFSIPLAQSLLFISFQTLFRLRAAEAQKIPVCSSVQLLSILSTALLYDNNESVNRFDFQAGSFCCCCCPVFIFLTLERDVI